MYAFEDRSFGKVQFISKPIDMCTLERAINIVLHVRGSQLIYIYKYSKSMMNHRDCTLCICTTQQSANHLAAKIKSYSERKINK